MTGFSSLIKHRLTATAQPVSTFLLYKQLGFGMLRIDSVTVPITVTAKIRDYCFAFAHESRKATVRLNTGAPGFDNLLSTQK